MKKEIKFTKYINRGDYHWKGSEKKISNILYFNAFLYERYQQVLKRIKIFKQEKKILDVGCGDAALSKLIFERRKIRLVGIDPSEEAISLANSKFDREFSKYKNRYKFLVGNGYKIPFFDNSFDYVILADVIEHVNKPERLLTEIRRVVKPSGKIIISSVIKHSKKTQDILHFKEFSKEEFKELLKKYFKEISIYNSHPVILKNLYKFYIKIGKYKPQPFRYLINLFVIIFEFNPFCLENNPSACQIAEVIK